MFDKLRNDDDRGQVGIGTLIVFIAMVLVAAIAAGVLINTAGFLQSSAEETGQQSSDQVTNRLDAVNTVGTNIDGDANTVDQVEVTVKKAPGAGNIDLGQVIMQVVHSSGSYDLTKGGTANASYFSISTVQEDGSDSSISDSSVLNDPADRATITINVDNVFEESDTSTGGNGLSEGDTATIRLNTQSGGTTELRLVVPETLSSDSAVQL